MSRVFALRGLVVGLLLSVGVAGGALAGAQDFTLVNDTGYPLRAVFVSPSNEESWEEDILGKDILEDEDSVDLEFDRSHDECLWDIKVIYDDDGSSAVWHEIDLCKWSEITIQYDRRTDRSTALLR